MMQSVNAPKRMPQNQAALNMLVQEDKLISFTLCMMLCFPQIISSMLNILSNMLGHTIPPFTVFLYFTYYFSVLYTLVRMLKRMTISRFFITFVFVLFILLTYAFNEKARKYIWTDFFDLRGNPMYMLFFFAYAAFLLSDYLHDVSLFLRTLQWFSRIGIILALFHYITGAISGTTPQYMTFSYNALLPTAFLWTCSFSRFSILLAVIGTLLIFVAGCRGALLCLLLGVILYYAFFKEMHPVKRFLMIFIGSIVFLCLLFFWGQIMNSIIDLLKLMGVSSRNVEKIVNNDFFSDSGRSIYKDYIKKNAGAIGIGLFGDRSVMHGHYAHSILYELIIDFGWPLGIGLFLSWIAMLIYALVKADEPGRRLMCVLLPGGCFKLFLSGSFLSQEPAFYMLLGVAFNCIMTYRSMKSEEILLAQKTRPNPKPVSDREDDKEKTDSVADRNLSTASLQEGKA